MRGVIVRLRGSSAISSASQWTAIGSSSERSRWAASLRIVPVATLLVIEAMSNWVCPEAGYTRILFVIIAGPNQFAVADYADTCGPYSRLLRQVGKTRVVESIAFSRYDRYPVVCRDGFGRYSFSRWRVDPCIRPAGQARTAQ